MSTGLRLPLGGSQTACALRGTALRAALPLLARSTGVRCAARSAFAVATVVIARGYRFSAGELGSVGRGRKHLEQPAASEAPRSRGHRRSVLRPAEQTELLARDAPDHAGRDAVAELREQQGLDVAFGCRRSDPRSLHRAPPGRLQR